jgi:hypothetical protein
MATAVENADLEAICLALAEKRPVDPEVSKRVEERADKVRAEIARRGLTNVAVELIREAREDE